MTADPWEPWEDRVIRRSSTWGEAHRRLSHRSDGAIRHRAHAIGVMLGTDQLRRWTPEEEAQLAACAWSDLPALAKVLDRSLAALKARRARLRGGA